MLQMAEISLVIIEDNKFIRNGWEIIFNTVSKFKVIGSFSSCDDAFGSASLKKADLVLLDLKLPGISGIEGAKYLKRNYPNILILISTAYEDDTNVFDAISAGAVGFIPKKTNPDELIKTIEITLKGGSPMTPNVARKILLRQTKKDFGGNGFEKAFSDIQKSIIEKIATGKTYNVVANELNTTVQDVMMEIRNIYTTIHKKLIRTGR